MLERQVGGITKVSWMDTAFDDRKYNPEIYIHWQDKWTGEELNILFMKKEEAKKLVNLLNKTIEDMDEHEARIKETISTTNFGKLYKEFEDRYNPYPVQMSRAECFGRARSEGLITDDLYNAARRFYKGLWSYVGD